jgi:tRNA1Val (adenine37-N6)-methyltransferase
MSSNSIHQNFLVHKSVIETALAEPVTISGLVGPLRIFQRVNGHRHSIDDATTAWYALQKCPGAEKVLDLGTGIGSVGLAVLWGLGDKALLTCVEAQDVSFRLLKANIECNELSERVHAIHGDIRQLTLDEKFPLVTGSPPYFPADAGIIPSDSQKAYARFELRGDVADYAHVAKRHLTEDGVFVFCFPFQQKQRCIRLVKETGFKIVTIRDIVPRADKPPLFSLYSARMQWNAPTVEEPPFIVADANNRYSEEMLELQRTRGFGPEGTNTIDT